MTGMRILLGLALCAAAIAALALLLSRGGDEPPAAAPVASEETAAPSAAEASVTEPLGGQRSAADLDPARRPAGAAASATRSILRGRVIERETSSPIPGASIRLVMPGQGEESGRVVQADEKGLIRARDLPGHSHVDLEYVPREDERDRSWRIRPGSVYIPRAGKVRQRGPVLLRVDAAQVVLRVRVIDAEDRPVPEALVTASWPGPRREWARSEDALSTDAQGEALYPLFGQSVGRTIFLEAASKDGSSMSGSLRLDPPHASRLHVLRVLEPAELSVRVLDDDGRALSGTVISLLASLGGTDYPVSSGNADAEGSFRFHDLAPGSYSVHAWHQASDREAEQQIHLLPGHSGRVDLRLAPGTIGLAAAGWVLDESGRPLADLEVSAEVVDQRGKESQVQATTDEEGGFELWARRAPWAQVEIGGRVGDDRYEPAVQLIPFGSRDLTIRRIESYPWREASVRATDAATGEPLGGAWIWARSPSGKVRRIGKTDDEGVWTEEIRAGPRDEWCVTHILHRPFFFTLPAAPPGEALLVEAALSPGCDLPIRIIDGRTGAPIAGAGVWRSGVLLARSASDGWARPGSSVASRASLRVIAGGYASTLVSPFKRPPWGSAVKLEANRKKGKPARGGDRRRGG